MRVGAPSFRERPHAGGTAALYDPPMMQKRLLLSLASAAVISIGTPALAEGYQFDGQLPMYPNSTRDAREASLTPAAIAHGVPLVLLTSDSTSTVAAWYASHAPKACSKQTASGGMKFACPGGSIMIYAHDGKTQVALIPPMGM